MLDFTRPMASMASDVVSRTVVSIFLVAPPALAASDSAAAAWLSGSSARTTVVVAEAVKEVQHLAAEARAGLGKRLLAVLRMTSEAFRALGAVVGLDQIERHEISPSLARHIGPRHTASAYATRR